MLLNGLCDQVSSSLSCCLALTMSSYMQNKYTSNCCCAHSILRGLQEAQGRIWAADGSVGMTAGKGRGFSL